MHAHRYHLLVCGEKATRERSMCATVRESGYSSLKSSIPSNTTGLRRDPTRKWGYVTNTSPMNMWYRPHRHVQVYCGRVPTLYIN